MPSSPSLRSWLYLLGHCLTLCCICSTSCLLTLTRLFMLRTAVCFEADLIMIRAFWGAVKATGGGMCGGIGGFQMPMSLLGSLT